MLYEEKQRMMSLLEQEYDNWAEKEKHYEHIGAGRRGPNCVMTMDIDALFNQLMWAIKAKYK